MTTTQFPFWMLGKDMPAARSLTMRAPARPFAAGNGLSVETLSLEAAARCEGEWRALVGRALEPNVFCDPAFALAAAQHLPASRRPLVVAIWRDNRDLVGLALASAGRPGLVDAPGGLWRDELVAQGAPLLDRDCAGEALDALLQWLGRRNPEAPGALVSALPLEGATAELLRARAGDDLRTFDARERAVLMPDAAAGAVTPLASGKKLKELRRLRRRLGERGELVYRQAASVADVRAATERFLALESQGWKGARGSALLCDASLAVFLRSVTRAMARAGQCRIDSLDLDGVPVAMGIVIASGGRAAWWKTAYDETFGEFSPGVLLAQDLSAAQRGDAAIALTDSCAISGHPMIDHLWRDRLRVGDVYVPLPGAGARAFAAAARRETMRRSLRETAKRAYYNLRPARVS